MIAANKNMLAGIGLALSAAIIWSGNFVAARGISGSIPPITLNFYRWGTAAVVILPFAWKQFVRERATVRRHWKYFVLASVTCIVLFNTFLYVAGHHTSAINMALISTTSSPVFTMLLAAAFLKERITVLRIVGMLVCMSGVAYLISQGSLARLLAFRFSAGDWWILTGAFFFAVYNLLAKAKPAGISSLNFLFVFCALGALILLPFQRWEHAHSEPVQWTPALGGIILYLGAGTSFLAYLCWNAAIARIGASRTSLFGNLIPIFSTLEALAMLDERFTAVHAISGSLVIAGIFVANLDLKQ